MNKVLCLDTQTNTIKKTINLSDNKCENVTILKDNTILFTQQNTVFWCTVTNGIVNHEKIAKTDYNIDSWIPIESDSPLVWYIFFTMKKELWRVKITFYEEDSQDFTSFRADNANIKRERSVDSCINDNLMTMSSYTDDDEPIMVYMPNSRNEFENSICITKEELVAYLRAFQDTSTPDNIMTIYSKGDVSGYGSKPLGKIVVKLPVNNIYITMGSMQKIIKSANTTWYALPLFGGKRRRIGNLKGLYGASMNHGQVPGYLVYKLYTREEVDQGVEAIEEGSDYPVFYIEHASRLFDILGGFEYVNASFVKGLIDMMIGAEVQVR
jgi:hypothetical protein